MLEGVLGGVSPSSLSSTWSSSSRCSSDSMSPSCPLSGGSVDDDSPL